MKKSSTSKPQISIVVPTYKRISCIKKLIDSLVNSDFEKNNCELVLVSSDDETSEKVQWIKKITEVNVNLIIEDKRENSRKKSLNFYENIGIKNSTKDWILVCNDDMWFEKDWYSKFTEKLSESKVYLVATHVGTVRTGLRIPSLGFITKDNTQEDMWLYDMSIIHKTIYEEINYLDENINWYGKGADLSLSVSFLTNEKPILCPEVKIHHDLIHELRAENRGSFDVDSQYIRNKWNKWIIDNKKNYSYIWN